MKNWNGRFVFIVSDFVDLARKMAQTVQPLAKVQKSEDATRLASEKRLYYGHLRCEMAKQSHLKIVLQVALLTRIDNSKVTIDA